VIEHAAIENLTPERSRIFPGRQPNRGSREKWTDDAILVAGARPTEKNHSLQTVSIEACPRGVGCYECRRSLPPSASRMPGSSRPPGCDLARQGGHPPTRRGGPGCEAI